MKNVFAILLLCGSALAVNRTVKAGGGGDCTVIQTCVNLMAAGDTTTVFAGTYNEVVTVTAGTAGNLKTLTVNPGDTVFVYAFSLNSYTKVNGFHIQRPASPTANTCITAAAGSTGGFITNNDIQQCSQGIRLDTTAGNQSHWTITGNTISYTCSTPASPNVCRGISINGDFTLIANNDISHVSDGIFVYGSFQVVVRNTFHDIHTNECHSNSSNCHVDFLQADTCCGALAAKFLLIEGNTIQNNFNDGNSTNCDTGSGCQPAVHGGPLLQGAACTGCTNAIVRFTKESHNPGGVTTDDDTAWPKVKEYNNSWIDVNQSRGNGDMTNNYLGSPNTSDINNIYYYVGNVSDMNPYGLTGAGGAYGHNLGFCTGGTCLLRPHTYGTGTFTADPGNLQTNPLFTNYAGNDFTLQAGSPARNAGGALTTVNGSVSNSNSLVVTDAAFFQDGYTLTGVQADCIAVTSITNKVCITAVNYTTNTLTLASPVTATNGDPVYIYSISDGTQVLTDTTGPDMGAFPYQSTPPAPSPAMFASGQVVVTGQGSTQ